MGHIRTEQNYIIGVWTRHNDENISQIAWMIWIAT